MTKRDRSILFRAFHNPDEFKALYHRILEGSYESSRNLPAQQIKEDKGIVNYFIDANLTFCKMFYITFYDNANIPLQGLMVFV